MTNELTETKLVSLRERRSDGLAIFPDNDEMLNHIRRTAYDRRTVILAVAIRRAQQIAINYARKHAPDIEKEIIGLTGRIKLLSNDSKK